ncbi:MAG TPA: hypothetical protein VGM68_07235 [Rhizomicrobium sp.]|jgi:hypothetical protein
MTAVRREIPPNEQLWALRHARDRYQALAEKLKDDPAFEGSAEEKRAQELEARRFAGAYEKSVANMVASCRERHVDLDASASGSVQTRFAILVFLLAAIVAGAYFVLPHPDLPRVRIVFEPATQAPMTAKKENVRPVPLPVPAIAPPSASVVSKPQAPVKTVRAILQTPKANVETSSRPVAADDGFVTKVLQPDGSLQEKFFKTRPAR